MHVGRAGHPAAAEARIVRVYNFLFRPNSYEGEVDSSKTIELERANACHQEIAGPNITAHKKNV